MHSYTEPKGLNVLIVDDEEINVEILKRSLKREGFSSSCCYDGEEALDTLVKNPNSFDLVLLDKMMPKMNGLEVLNKMKNHNSLKQIPVIIQTGDVNSKQEQESLLAGAYYYLTKPFDHKMLISLIISAMQNNKSENTVQ